MASPQPDKFTRISSELLEVLPLVKWTVAERAIIDVVMRKTYGFNKKVDWVSNSQFVELTGMYKQHTSRAVMGLLRKNVLYKSGKKIGIQKDYEKWKVEWRLSYTEVTLSYREVTFVIHRGTTIEDNSTIDTTPPSGEKLQASKNSNQENMFNQKSDDYLEEEIQTDPDHKPKGKKKQKKVSDDVQAVFDLFENPASALWRMREIERVAAQVLFDTYGLETLEKRIKRIKLEQKTADEFFPVAVTPSQLLDKMPNIERYLGI